MEDIVELFVKENKSVSELAKSFHCSRDKVRKILNQNGIETNIKRNQFSTTIKMDETLFNEINSEETAYWLGFLYADGNIRKNRNEVSLTLQEKDLVTLQNFHKFCKNNNNILRHSLCKNGKMYVSYTSSFSSQSIKNNLINLGCVPVKSMTLTFPTKEQVPNQFLNHFIRGYIDGDGYIQYDLSKSRYRIIILGTYNFLSGLLDRTGWTVGSKIYQSKNEKIFRLELSQKQLVKDRLELIYGNSNIYLPRKYAIYELTKLGA